MSLTKVTYAMIQNAPANVNDYGAVGNGIADDTVAIQSALDSGASTIVFSSGQTYLIDGGLALSESNITIIATGATIKLKANATYKKMLTLTGDYNIVDGGTWDGNRTNGNSSGSEYNSWAVGLAGDYCVCKNATIKSIYGIGIYGIGNYLRFENNNITDFIYWGIQIQGGGQDYYGNKAIGNNIDSSAGGANGHGILFTSGGTTGDNQIDWEISNNNITGPQGAIADQAINISVRGIEGIVSNNTTRYGAMGFSEGGSGTVISNNRFFDLAGTYRYGIEAQGTQLIIGNYITNALLGIVGSGTVYDKVQIIGNTIEASTNCISFQNFGSTGGVYNALISGNNLIADISTAKGINLQQNSTNPPINITINSNFFNGLETGVILDQVNGPINITVSNNTFKNGTFGCRVFSTVAATVSELYNYSNTYINVSSTAWDKSVIVTFGTDVININNIVAGSGAKLNILDQVTNLLTQYGTGTPEGSVTAAIGSTYYRTNGGAGTTLYVKESGTGNTGWVGK